MHFDDRFADSEPEAESFAPVVALLERFEDFLEIARFDADPGVADLYEKSLRLRVVGPDSNRSLPRSEFVIVPKSRLYCYSR